MLMAPVIKRYVDDHIAAGDPTFCSRCRKNVRQCKCPERMALDAIKINEPIGRPADFKPALPRRTACATALTASNTGTTAATTATLAGAVGKTTYICSLSVRANATANANVTNTVTGVITGTLSRAMWVPANTAGLGVDEQIFTPCVPSSATNTAIAVVSGAPGTGGVVSVTATGYQAP